MSHSHAHSGFYRVGFILCVALLLYGCSSETSQKEANHSAAETFPPSPAPLATESSMALSETSPVEEQKDEEKQPSPAPFTYEQFRTLEIELRLKDANGVRWMHNASPMDKGLFLDFSDTCNGCTILYPRKYKNDPTEVQVENRFFIPPAGNFRFLLPDDTNSVTVRLVDLEGNGIYIEDDGGFNTDDGKENDLDASVRTKQVAIESKTADSEVSTKLSYFVMRDDTYRKVATTMEECETLWKEDKEAVCTILTPAASLTPVATPPEEVKSPAAAAAEAQRIEAVRAWANQNKVNLGSEARIKRIATSDLETEWKQLREVFLEGKVHTDHDYVIIKLRMGQDGTKIYQEIAELLRSDSLTASQKGRRIGVLGEIGTPQSIDALLDVIEASRLDTEDAFFKLAAGYAVQAVGASVRSSNTDRNDAARISQRLEPILLAKKDDLESFAQIAGGIALIGAESGVELLLQELAGDPYFPERVEIYRNRKTFLSEQFTRLIMALYGETVTPSPTAAQQTAHRLENALSEVRSSEGTELLIRCLQEGQPADFRTIACGRVLARMYHPVNPENQNEAARAAIHEWSIRADDAAVPLAAELYEIIFSANDLELSMQVNSNTPPVLTDPAPVWNAIKDRPFQSEKVRSAIEQSVREQERKIQEQQKSAAIDEAALKCRGNQNPVAFKRLADETTFPFLFFGRPLSEDRHDYGQYMDSIGRFPDVRSCLKDSEREKDTPNLALFDWEKIRGTNDAEVCFFRVFSSIGSVAGSRQWAESQGFRLEGSRVVEDYLMRSHGEKKFVGRPEDEAWYREKGHTPPMENPDVRPGISFNGGWNFKTCGTRIKDWGAVGSYSLTFGTTFNADEEIDTVGVNYNFL